MALVCAHSLIPLVLALAIVLHSCATAEPDALEGIAVVEREIDTLLFEWSRRLDTSDGVDHAPKRLWYPKADPSSLTRVMYRPDTFLIHPIPNVWSDSSIPDIGGVCEIIQIRSTKAGGGYTAIIRADGTVKWIGRGDPSDALWWPLGRSVGRLDSSVTSRLFRVTAAFDVRRAAESYPPPRVWHARFTRTVLVYRTFMKSVMVGEDSPAPPELWAIQVLVEESLSHVRWSDDSYGIDPRLIPRPRPDGSPAK
jgi:hypothetical protein